jgi:hypothetical protein
MTDLDRAAACLNANQLAARWGISADYIRQTKHRLEHLKLGRKVLFPLAAVVAYENANRRGPHGN